MEEKNTESTRLDDQLFFDAFKASAIGIVLEDLDGRPLFVNPAFCSMLGFSEQELRNKHCVDFSPPEDAEKDWALFQQLRAGSISHYSLDKRYFRRDGSLLWGRLSISLLNHRPTPLVIAMVENISEKRTAEEKFSKAFRRSPTTLSISSARDHRYIDVNETFERLTGYSRQEIIGRTPFDLGTWVNPFQRLELATRLLKEGRIIDVEARFCRKDGQIWIGSTSLELIEIGAGPCILALTIDVTERKRAEEALHQANRALEAQTTALQAREELLKIFVKHVPAGVAMLDRDMRYLQVSDRWCADYGLDSSQVLGRSHYELFPDIPDRWKEVHRRGLAGETVRADEDRWDRESGTRWDRWEIRPWWSRPDSLPGGILIFSEDITRRKEMEDALSTVSQKLIEAHEAERTRIARELHDDINQRLALLAVKLESVQQSLPASAEIRTAIAQANKEVEDLGSDIQTLSHRLHSSKLEYLGLAKSADGLCREFSDRHSREIIFRSENIPKDLPQEISVTLFRVLQEALQNAIKHSGSRDFRVSLSGGSNHVELIVSDSGVGFDPEAAIKGRGLGLTSIKERLKLVNGTLSIDSQPQRGTRIQARVPLSPQAKSTGAAAG